VARRERPASTPQQFLPRCPERRWRAFSRKRRGVGPVRRDRRPDAGAAEHLVGDQGALSIMGDKVPSPAPPITLSLLLACLSLVSCNEKPRPENTSNKVSRQTVPLGRTTADTLNANTANEI